MGAPQKNWDDLANAIIERAVRDFEYAISDRPIPQDCSLKDCSREAIMAFAKKQALRDIDLVLILKNIEKDYRTKFRPYALKHYKEIKSERARLGRKYDTNPHINERVTHRCPVCGGALMICGGYVHCTYCNLNVKIPKEKKKCTT